MPHPASSSLSDRLQELTEQLAAARTPDEVFRVVLTPALAALDAVAGAVLLVDEEASRLTLAVTQGDEADVQTVWQDGPLERAVPAGDALERHEALFFEHPGELARAYPELEARTGGVAAVATAVLPMFLDERPLGTIILDFREPHTFTQDERRFLRTLAAQCAVALGRARLMTELQRQVQERSGQLETDARAQEAFMAFTEAVGTETDLLALARQAIAVLRARFQDGSIAYHTRRGEVWTPEVWSEDMEAPLVARLQAGLADRTPFIRQALRTGTVDFTDGWNPVQEGIAHSEAYGAAATYPLVVNGEVQALLVFGLRDTRRWSGRDRALVRAVGRGLILALERAAQARLLQTRGEELEARTLALERFAELARRPESDPLTLIRQAQEAVSELIGEGFAVYYELGAGVWHLRSQVGHPENRVVQASLDSALPYETVLNFRRPWESGEPLYQDVYDQALDDGVPGTGALASTAALPLVVGGRHQGMFGYGLEVSRPWSRADRATLETAVSSLGLAFERAEQTGALEEERAALDAFVAFSEAAGTETDVSTLARQAVTALTLRFPGCSSAYYELEGGRWTLRLHNDDLNHQPELRAALLAGLPRDTPSFAQALKSMRPVFVENWDAAQEQIARTEAYGAVANAPLVQGGEVQAILSLGLRGQRQWAERDRAVFRAVARGLTLALERAGQARHLQARQAEEARRSQALSAFAELSRDLALETEPYTLILRTQEIVLSLLSAGFSVYFEPREGVWRIGSQVGHANTPELQAALEAGLSFEAATNLVTPWRSGEAYYQDEYDPDLDGLTGSEAYPGASVTLPIVVNGHTRGVLGFALYRQRSWSGEDRAVLDTVSRQLTLALERAEQTRRLAEEREALEAFARFTEASTHTTDPLTLAEGVRDVLRATIGVEAGYSELEGGLWKGRVFSDLTPPEVRAQSVQGFPANLPVFAHPFAERAIVFVDDWRTQNVAHTEMYGAAALYPYFGAGQPRGLLTMGTTQARAWTARERSVFRSVGRSLALAFERAEAARHLQTQNAELAARTQALEGFAELTRDLSTGTDRLTLVRRAQEVALSLLPDGYALYFEPQGDWRVLRAQTGELRSAALQAAADQGFPVQEARNLFIPYTTLKPYYQDQYDIDTDTIGELGAHLGATATFPVLLQGQPKGVMAVVLFGGARPWARPDQAALESVVRSLGLALERAEGLARLEARTQEVAQWRERYEVAVKGSGHLLYDWNPRTGEILYGGAVEGITGYAPEELAGTLDDWTEWLIHPDDRDAFTREIGRVVASGEEFHLPFRVLRKDGTVAQVEDDGYFKRDASNEVTRMVGLVKDVTERERAQAELLRTNEELRRSNAELEQFAYIASHDLQAPIRSVTSFSEILASRYEAQLDERGVRYLRFITESGQHMKRLVDDLLTFSRVDTEQRPPTPTDSGAVVEQVWRRLMPEVEALEATVTFSALPRVLVDRRQLDQLLQNLLANALKYHRPGVPPRLQVSAEWEGACWRFAITDNGLGIESQYFEKVFVIFQRLHGQGVYQGTGIGLAVCKKIVECHGGRLWVESVPGEGSTFLFTLPAA
ncbi:GAF domain-containing protein [Deinococcus koreensis]|uniref:GAF domain-containing protein n=1 Tax=Deinococcus koreensis TaxID=2054903 RepID=UPI001057596C|nr:GAF domain-containing protein [Deinococcus koreensis]